MNLDQETTEKIIKKIADAKNMNASSEMIHDALKEYLLPEDDIYFLIKAGELLYQYRLDIIANANKTFSFRRG